MPFRLAFDLPPPVVLTACLSCSWVHEFPGTCPRSSETWRTLTRALGGEAVPRHGLPALPADLDELDPWNSTTPAVQAFVEFFRTNQTMMNNTFQPMVRDAIPPTLYRAEARSEAEFACALICVPYHAWTVVDVEVVDPSAFTVAVTVLDVWRTVTLTGAGRLVATVTMDIDVLGDSLIDYQVVG